MSAKALLSVVWLAFSGILYCMLDHFLYSWLVLYLDAYGIKEANVIASISSYVIPAVLSSVIIWGVYRAGKLAQLHAGSAKEQQQETPPPLRIGSPFQIEFGDDDRYKRPQHIEETGMFRRTIHISVFNGSLEDISDCNIKLIAATPTPNTGDHPTQFPIYFEGHFDLPAKQRKFMQIVSFAENPGNATPLERDHIIISAASGGFFPGFTTMPIPSRDSPAIFTLEAFVPSIASRMAHLHIWVNQRRIHAQII